MRDKNLERKIDEINCVKKQKGQSAVGCLVTFAAMPVCAMAFSYVGEGLGYVGGNIVDFIPYVRDVAPWLAERAGLVDQNYQQMADLNENLYQTAGAVNGFWGGLFLPLCVLFRLNN